MPLPREEAWFAANSGLLGWGMPLRWQGWVAVVTYVGLTYVGYLIWRPAHDPARFFISLVALSVIFVVVCWLTGEKTS